MPVFKKYFDKAQRKVSRFIREHSYPIPKNIIYELDLQGYTIIRNLLPAEDVQKYNALIDAYQNGAYPREFPTFEISAEFLKLAAHPRVMEIMQYALGEHFRLDHFYGLQSGPSQDDISTKSKMELYQSRNIHSGPYTEQASFQYHWFGGRMYQGVLACAFALHPVGEGEGGLILIPGSHKQNMAIEPIEINQLKWQQNSELLWQQPVFNPGDMLIFSEATVHGSTPWLVPDRPRRMLYYKYCPGYMCWRNYEEIKKYLPYASTSVLQDLLRPPYVSGLDEDYTEIRKNNWRPPTRIKE